VNLPNSLTVVRIFLVPLLVVVLLTLPQGWHLLGISKEAVGAAIFAVASLTDWLDGYLARRRQQITGFGQWMDPLADKMLITAALFALVSMGVAPAWMAAVILGREFLVTVLRSIAHARGQALPASPLGKVKMLSQVVAVLALILSRGPAPQLLVVGTIALWIATFAALVSAGDYYRRFNSVMSAKPAALPASAVVAPGYVPAATAGPPAERRRDRASA
jgi:CDP-diacylglycerol--glycerol-3-phosphate 3-phosphatidyltransferase